MPECLARFPAAYRNCVGLPRCWGNARAQAYPSFWERIPGPSRSLDRGAMVEAVLVAFPSWRWLPLDFLSVEVVPHHATDFVNRFKQTLERLA